MIIESKDLIVLGAIMRGKNKFDEIKKDAQIDGEELNSILEKLEERGFISVQERKGLFGSKIEIIVTEDGSKEVDNKVYELNQQWNQMSLLYKEGNKQKLKQYLDENKSVLPSMMFFGIMDMMMFSMMFSMIGMMMTDYIPQENIPEGLDGENGDADMSDNDFDIGF
jgi:DNA-binding HxlR family transcriptional regulator